MDNEPCVNRRQLLGGVAFVGVCAPLLAACGTSDKAKSEVPGAGTELATISDVPVGGGLILAKQNVVLTQPTEGSFEAFEATCTHARCTVTSVDTTINCKCHGSKFSTTDGSVAQGPATAPLPAVKISVDGTSIVTA